MADQTKPPPARGAVLSPWDEGPSLALPERDSNPGRERLSGIWGMHTAPAPDAKTTRETTAWLNAANELLALNDFTGALELAGKVLSRMPENPSALAVRDICELNLIQMNESRLGDLSRRPRVLMNPDEVIWLNLDPRAGFVLAQIDGTVSCEELYAICGLSHLDTARILSELLQAGVIGTD